MITGVILQRIFEDTELKDALTAFFEAEAAGEEALSLEMMAADRPEIDRARKHACFAKAYEEAIHRLRAYARQV